MSKPDKRDEIVRAALELIAEHGFHGAPMAMIAARAGVAAGTIYRYFESKEVLIHETYNSLEKEIMTAIMAGCPEVRPIRERFLHICQQLVNYFLRSPMEFSFVEQFHNSPFGAACRRDKLLGRKEKDIVTRLFEEGQKQRIIKELPLPVLKALTFGPLVNVCRDHILLLIVLDQTLITRTVEACWDAVKR